MQVQKIIVVVKIEATNYPTTSIAFKNFHSAVGRTKAMSLTPNQNVLGGAVVEL